MLLTVQISAATYSETRTETANFEGSCVATEPPTKCTYLPSFGFLYSQCFQSDFVVSVFKLLRVLKRAIHSLFLVSFGLFQTNINIIYKK